MNPSDSPTDATDERFQLLVNAVTDYAIYMLDPNGRIATWNAGAERFKGYTADEIIGEHFSRFFTPEDQAAELPTRALRIAAREGRFEAEGWRLRKDGSRFWANAILDPIRSPSGDLIGFAKITRDVTARKDAERAIRESEQRFRLLVQGVRDYAIYMLDPDGRITNWNSGAEAIKGYAAEDVIGRHFSLFYTEEDRASGVPAVALRTALETGKYENDAWRVRKDGTLIWANVVIDPIYDESGKHIGFAKITRDMTDRKRVQEELEETRASLVQSQKLQALGELTGGIAHDFNNLMTVVAGSTDLLLAQPDMPPEKRRRYLVAIAETAKRASTLTSHLLAFSRRRTLRPEVIDLNVRLDALGEMLSRTIGSRIALDLDLRAEHSRVEVDPTELETAVLNAVVNARDAMPDGGSLTVRTIGVRRDGADQVQIEISDTGSGMPADVIERAFEPFFTTKPVGQGTGLGLSQIHGFAAQAGGKAEIESETGTGTTLRIVLPRSDQPLTVPAAEAALTPIPQGLRVLLVEDNQQVRDFAENVLQDLGCIVTSAADAQQALNRLEEEEFDLLFSDVVMPGMSGVDLAARLQVERPGLPVLLASGYSAQLIGDAARSYTILPKPYGAGSLSAAISSMLAAQSEAA